MDGLKVKADVLDLGADVMDPGVGVDVLVGVG